MRFQTTKLFILFVLMIVSTQSVRHEAILSPDFTLSYEVIDKLFLDIVATVKTSGWVGIALNSQAKMDGADMVIGGVENGTNYLYNYRGAGHSLVQKETSNWKAGSVAFSESGNQTIVSFKRPLDTGDNDVIVIEDVELYLLWAYGEDDNVRKRHIARGSIKVNLLNPSGEIKSRSDSLIWSIV